VENTFGHSLLRDASHGASDSAFCVAKESLFVFRVPFWFAKLCPKKIAAMNTRTLVHLCLTCFFVLAILWVMGSWPQWAKDEKIMNQFMAIVVIAVVGGFFLVLVVLPRFGDAVGTAMISSNAEVKQEGASKAQALLARGDYEGAIKEYEGVLAEKPEDAFTVSEIAKVCNEKLKDPIRGLHVLRQHLESREWAPDDAAFLMFRMVDIHTQEENFGDAKELLEQITSAFPDTRHVGNARHRINEIEQAEYKLAQSQRGKGAQG
jgi:tetratricopeptide (TPR) repeat protein